MPTKGPPGGPERIPRTIVLVGLMGVGKTCIGRRLATRFGLPFVDADAEIEAAAGCSIEEIFQCHGEAAFRDGEHRVILRLLGAPTKVLSTGGGAFMNPLTRQAVRDQGISVWLRGDLDLLHKRTSRRNNRPLLKRGNPREILGRLIEERYPVYAEADVTVDSADGPPDITVDNVQRALTGFIAARWPDTAGVPAGVDAAPPAGPASLESGP